jgi:hypothetical protein
MSTAPPQSLPQLAVAMTEKKPQALAPRHTSGARQMRTIVIALSAGDPCRRCGAVSDR